MSRSFKDRANYDLHHKESMALLSPKESQIKNNSNYNGGSGYRYGNHRKMWAKMKVVERRKKKRNGNLSICFWE